MQLTLSQFSAMDHSQVISIMLRRVDASELLSDTIKDYCIPYVKEMGLDLEQTLVQYCLHGKILLTSSTHRVSYH